MQTLTETILENQLGERILNDVQLARLLGGSNARRYGLVNRALQAGELHRLKRGQYLLDQRFRHTLPHPFVLAQAFLPSSHVSFESALSWHGWIPEAVYTTTSITPHRKSKTYKHTHYGHFTFHPLAIQKGFFLKLVERVQIDNRVALVARPVRALMDLIYYRKLEWNGTDFLLEGMRIELEDLHSVTAQEISLLKHICKHQQMQNYLDHFAHEILIGETAV